MLTVTLDPREGRPLYEQLYRGIRDNIRSGVLAPGEKLPSKRALCGHLKVSLSTVEGAYSQLTAEGYLRAEPKRGFFVQPLEPGSPRPEAAPPAPAPVPGEQAPEFDFSTGAVDDGHFPFSAWARLMRQVLTREDARLLSPIPPQGVPELRQAIVRYLRDFRGISADPEQVVVGAGSEYLTGLLFQLLGRAGGYAVEDPGYPKVHRILSHQGALVCPIPLDSQGLRVDALGWSGARVAHVTPAHHFPLGTVMPIARRQELLAWAEQGEDRYIIEDDYDSEFRFSGRPIPALQSLDRGERVVYLSTFAQSLAPSLRIGFLVLPPHLLERYRRELLFYSSTVPSFEQHTLAWFLAEGHFERHIARMRVEYRARRDAMVRAVKTQGLPGKLSGGDAGLHMLLELEPGPWQEGFPLRAQQAGMRVQTLAGCCLTPPSPRAQATLLLGFGRLGAEDIPRAVERLRDVLGQV